MSEPKTQQEPTMEEILASIRRIISEDGEEAAQPATAAPAAPAAKPAPVAPPAAPPAPPAAVKPEPPPPPPAAAPASPPLADDVLELTQMVKDDGSVVDLSAAAPEPPSPPPRAEPRPEPSQVLSQTTAAAAATSFSNLASAVSGARGLPIGHGARTIEELVKELLRPMLRDWLDANLPGLVQRIVEREVAKLAGRAEDDGRR